MTLVRIPVADLLHRSDWVEKPVDYDKYVEIIGKLTRTLRPVEESNQGDVSNTKGQVYRDTQNFEKSVNLDYINSYS